MPAASEPPLPIDRHDQLKSLFLLALETPPALRRGRLESECSHDPALFAEVSDLLSLHGDFGDLLDDGFPKDAVEPVPDLPAQLGPFLIEGYLGRGGMGVVYKARRQPQAPPLALKILREASLSSADLRRRFQREAEALKRLAHSGIARFIDAGIIEHAGRPVPYVATEYVNGLGLQEFIETKAPDPKEKLEILQKLCEALDHAHREGVVHRDLKPDNILVKENGDPVILDFGVARFMDPGTDGGTLLTRVGQLVGTPQYMSPEQAEAGQPVDGRSDLYSLGMIGFEILAGAPPYEVPRDSLHRAVVTILTSEPKPLSSIDTRFRGDVETLIARAVAKKPADRYPSAREMAADIRRHLEGKKILARPISTTRPPRMSRVRVLLPTLFLGAIAIVVSVPAARSRVAALLSGQSASNTLAAIAPDLEAANDLLHAGMRRKRPQILQAIQHLETARDDLSRLPKPPYEGFLRMFINWRMGEAYFFLGTMDHDFKTLALCEAAWARTVDASHSAKAAEQMDDSRGIVGEMLRLGRHHPLAGMAGVNLTMSEYTNPAFHIKRGLVAFEESYVVLTAKTPPNYPLPTWPDAGARLADSCGVYNGLAECLSLFGEMSGNAALIDRGLEVFARADSLRRSGLDSQPLSGLLVSFGAAFRRRADLTGSHADLDSARARVREAMSLRSPSETPRFYSSFHAELARIATIEARLASSETEKRARLANALEELEEARKLLAQIGDTLEGARVDLQTAGVLCMLAEAGDRPALAAADSFLTAAAAVISRSPFPIWQAEALLERVRLLRIQGTDKRQALALLDEAARVSPETENPLLARRLRAERNLLTAVGGP